MSSGHCRPVSLVSLSDRHRYQSRSLKFLNDSGFSRFSGTDRDLGIDPWEVDSVDSDDGVDSLSPHAGHHRNDRRRWRESWSPMTHSLSPDDFLHPFWSPRHDTGRDDLMGQRCKSESLVADVSSGCHVSQSSVSSLRHPTIGSLCRLRQKLAALDSEWMEDFLAHEGLELLFECLGHGARDGSSFKTILLKFECVRCIKSCINSRAGVEFLVSERRCYAPKFAMGKVNVE